MMYLLSAYSSVERILNLLTTMCHKTIEKSMMIAENSIALTWWGRLKLLKLAIKNCFRKRQKA